MAFYCIGEKEGSKLGVGEWGGTEGGKEGGREVLGISIKEVRQARGDVD